MDEEGATHEPDTGAIGEALLCWPLVVTVSVVERLCMHGLPGSRMLLPKRESGEYIYPTPSPAPDFCALWPLIPMVQVVLVFAGSGPQ